MITVKACDCGPVKACGCDHVKACGCDHVKACDCDHVTLCDCDHVKACGCDHVKACGCDHVSLNEAAGTTKVINLATNVSALSVFLFHGVVWFPLALVARFITFVVPAASFKLT